jgi:hypothetical protein
MASIPVDQIIFGDMVAGRKQSLEAAEEAGQLDDEIRDDINRIFDELSSVQEKLLKGLDRSKIRKGYDSFPKDQRTFRITCEDDAHNLHHYARCMIRFYGDNEESKEQISLWRKLEGQAILYLDQFGPRHQIKTYEDGTKEFLIHGVPSGVTASEISQPN